MTEETIPAAAPATTPGDFAARLASRLCHDFISPASAIVSGLDLLEDPGSQDMREEALQLIASSARKLVDLLTYSRIAFGGSSAAETFETDALKALAMGVAGHARPDLIWDVPPLTVSRAAARSLLNLAEMGVAAVPMGGTARVTTLVEDGWIAIRVECRGPRLILNDQVVLGLKGEPAPSGPAARWTQAYYVRMQLAEAGGVVAVEQAEDQIVFTAATPHPGGA